MCGPGDRYQERGQIRYMRPARRLHWIHLEVQEAWSIGLTMNDGRDVKGERAGKMAQRLKMLAAKPDGLVRSPGGGERERTHPSCPGLVPRD